MLWVSIVDQRRRARRDPAVGDARRPHRPQAGVHLRRDRQRRADVRLPRRDRERQLPADLRSPRSLMSGVVYSAMNGIQPSLYGEMFPTRVRLSGMAIGTQIGFAIGGFAPTAAAAIAGDGPGGWVPVRRYVLVSSLIAATAVATARETFRLSLAEIDGRDADAAASRGSAAGRPQPRSPPGERPAERVAVRRMTAAASLFGAFVLGLGARSRLRRHFAVLFRAQFAGGLGVLAVFAGWGFDVNVRNVVGAGDPARRPAHLRASPPRACSAGARTARWWRSACSATRPTGRCRWRRRRSAPTRPCSSSPTTCSPSRASRSACGCCADARRSPSRGAPR